MGRADQRTKVRGMFVDPEQIAEIAEEHGPPGAWSVDWVNQADVMTLKVEAGQTQPRPREGDGGHHRLQGRRQGRVRQSRAACPNDGKVIDDVRKYT